MPDIPDEALAIRHLLGTNGPEAGAPLIELRNAAGLSVDLLPGRCLDIGQVWYQGIPFGWVGPNGIPPARPGEMDTALGGLLCTCGFDHIRQPEIWEGRELPLHGSMSLSPARVESAAAIADPALGPAFRVCASVAHGRLSGQSWHLSRSITVPRDRPEILIEDRVEARAEGEVTPIMALYHFNLGAPLIGPGTAVTIAGRPRPELPGEDGFTRVEPAAPGGHDIALQSGIGDPRLRLRITADAGSLPFLQLHRRPAPGGLLCIEPASHDRQPRAALLADEAPLRGSRSRRFRLMLRFGPPG